ncbi:MAG: DsbA family protein, partial [Firmicutes bacterium]|nr:DsbA family protein [Bacillota bacterium]
LSNSRLALEASEFAREQGKFHAFHNAVFHAYFTEGRDIGDREILLSIGESVGLPRESLDEALTVQRYEEALHKGQDEGAQCGVSGTPTCIINGRYRVVGAQPIEAFRQVLRTIEKEGSAS